MQSKAIKSHQRAEQLRGGNQEVINSNQGSSAVREHRGARAPNLATSSPGKCHQGSSRVIKGHQRAPNLATSSPGKCGCHQSSSGHHQSSSGLEHPIWQRAARESAAEVLQMRLGCRAVRGPCSRIDLCRLGQP